MKQILIGLALCLSAAIAQNTTYGTQVNAAWYDRVAALYQNPPIVRDDRSTPLVGGSRFDTTRAGYKVQYAPLSYSAYIGSSAEGPIVVTSNPTPDEARAQNLVQVEHSTCGLLGEAGLSERIMREAVVNLGNVANNAALRESIVAVAQQDRIYVEFYSKEGKVAMVATVGGIRIPAEKIRGVEYSNSVPIGYLASHQAEFSLKRLRDANAIQKNIVTFQHGWSKSDFCTFDLSKLP